MDVYNNGIDSINSRNLFFINIFIWKKKTIKNIFSNSTVKFIKEKDIQSIKNDDNNIIIIWGINKFQDIKNKYPEYSFTIMEDGFIRSKSLGSDLAEPLSLIIDAKGIYFDPRTESGLENLIYSYELTNADIEAGLSIKNKMLSDNISKYNISRNVEDSIYKDNIAKNIKIIIGQVEDDASIIFGSNSIKTNLDLIKEVYRTKKDNDFLIYKPHPDVTSGNRVGKVRQVDVLEYCNYIDEETPIINILKHNNIEVHTITSLTGFENVLRGNKTVCYGNPFYSGWGFTTDIEMPIYIKNRRKDISITEFFTYAYIKYPIYYDNLEKKLSTAIDVIEIIKKTKEIKTNLITKIRRRIINFLKRFK